MRGYSGYYMTEEVANGDVNVYQGTSGIAFNTEIDYSDAIPYMNYFGVTSYLFMDVGVMNKNQLNESLAFSSIYMDMGVGFTWELSRLWNHVIDSEPLVLRVDLPLFLNKPPTEQNYMQLRCLIGFNRAF